MDIGKAIRVAAAERNLSMNRIGEEAEMSYGHINKIANGKVPGVTLHVLKKIAAALDMKLSDLIKLGE